MNYRKMNTKTALIAAVAATTAGTSAFCARPAAAQDLLPSRTSASVLPGGQTDELSLVFGSVSGGRRDNLAVSYGRFSTPRTQVGATVGLGRLSTVTTAGAFADYHFGPTAAGRSLVPYAGVFGGYVNPDGREGVGLGAQGGVKFFPVRDLALRGEVQHRRTIRGGTDTQLQFGVSTFLR